MPREKEPTAVNPSSSPPPPRPASRSLRRQLARVNELEDLNRRLEFTRMTPYIKALLEESERLYNDHGYSGLALSHPHLSSYVDMIAERNNHIRALTAALKESEAECDAAQAKVDALMLEFCRNNARHWKES